MPDTKKPRRPTERDMPVLRRAAAGAIICTHTEDGPQYTYEDGSYISANAKAIERMIQQRWLVPDGKDTLFHGDRAQRYTARKP